MLPDKYTAMSSSQKIIRLIPAITLLIGILIFSNNKLLSKDSDSKEDKERYKTVRYQNNVVQLGEQKVYPGYYIETLRKRRMMFLYTPLPDSIPYKDRATGEESIIPVPVDIIPVSLNGQPVFGSERYYDIFNEQKPYTPPTLSGDEQHLEQYLFKHLEQDLNGLEDGRYVININNLVIDNQGRVAYYDEVEIIPDYAPVEDKPMINAQLQKNINSQVVELLEAGTIRFQPAVQEGKAINVRLNPQDYQVLVKGHKATLVERPDC